MDYPCPSYSGQSWPSWNLYNVSSDDDRNPILPYPMSQIYLHSLCDDIFEKIDALTPTSVQRRWNRGSMKNPAYPSYPQGYPHYEFSSDDDDSERLSTASSSSVATITDRTFPDAKTKFEETDIAVDFGKYTIEGATSARSRLVKAFYPGPLPANAHITKSICLKPLAKDPDVGCGRCLLEDALEIEASLAQKPANRTERKAAKYAVKHAWIINPPSAKVAHEILFEATNPCPKSKGVALTDIMEMKELYILDADKRVMRDLPSQSRIIHILIQFPGAKLVKFPVRIGCDCGDISRAKLAREIVNAVRIYQMMQFQQVIIKCLFDRLQLVSLARVDDKSHDWTPRFAFVEI